jgi:osmotically inducible lipoprotein OsmB
MRSVAQTRRRARRILETSCIHAAPAGAVRRVHVASLTPESNSMNLDRKTSFAALTLALSLGLGACAGMSTQDKSTAVGAGVGAVAGAVLTGGSGVGTVGGAVVGGVIGNEVGKK